MTEPIATVGRWSERTFWGLVGGILTLGVVLLALNGPFSDVRSLRLVIFVSRTVPLVLAVLVYVRVYPTASPLEVIGVAIWGYAAITLAGVFAFFAFADLSSSYPGPTRELLQDVARFLLTTVVVGGLYAIAAASRDRPLLAGLVLLLVPLGRFLLYAVV